MRRHIRIIIRCGAGDLRDLRVGIKIQWGLVGFYFSMSSFSKGS